MKRLLLAWMAAAAVLVACSDEADFGGPGGKKSSGAVVPKNGVTNPEKDPVDLSKLEKNKKNHPDGPKGGKGQRLNEDIELTCEDSQGAEIVVGDVDGAEKGDLKLLGQDEKQVEVGKDGKPVGGPKDGGKKGDKDKDLPGKDPKDTPKDSEVVAKVKGEFCPTNRNKLTVLFVVDYSGSMGRHVPGRGQAEVPGNDPQVSGSCGRLRAAQAILDRIAAERKEGEEIRIGMVPFAGGIVTDHILEVKSYEEFASQVSNDTFCQYVVQGPEFGYDPENPGGIDGGSIDSSTNYKAAFQAAESILTPLYGRKVTYFISDGEPTSGGADPVLAGRQAGESLRANVDNLSMNGLLLGNAGPDADDVLKSVTGAPDRVRRADNADQLAEKILEFPDASIDEESGRATLTAPPYPTEELGLRYLAEDQNRPGIWTYETQPFVLLGEPGETIVNTVTVTAEGRDGSTHEARVRIQYRQE